MPDARLARTRASLPVGYQFGDGGFGDGVTDCLIALPPHAVAALEAAARSGHIRVLKCSDYLGLNPKAGLDPHRADTLDPPGYGHAV